MRWTLIQRISVCVMAAYLCSCGGGGGGESEPEKKEVPVGYRGEARVNPFLAAERFVEKMGMDADSQMYMVPLPDDSGTMIVPAEAVVGSGIAEELVRWIRRGGHLIYLVSGGDSAADDFLATPTGKLFQPEVEVDHALLEKFKIEVVEGGDVATEVTWGRDTFQCRFEKGARVDFRNLSGARGARRLDSISGARDAAVFGSFPVVSGRLTVLADATLWRNRFIGEEDHAALLWEVVSRDEGRHRRWGELTIVIGVGSSFWALLVKHGWMALLALALVVGVWLWKNLTRFGPQLIVGQDHLREFTENVAMAGNFLWSKRRSDVLLDAARRRMGETLRRAHVTLELDSEEAVAYLAGTSGLPEARVQEALRAHGTKDATAIVRLMQDLQRMEGSL